MVRLYSHNLLQRFSYETGTWERQLEYFKQELLYFQLRLAETINETNDPGILLQAERFNEDFIGQDFATNFLLEEIYRLNILLDKNPEPGSAAFIEMQSCQRKLGEDIVKEEFMFRELKGRFFRFLEECS